MDSIHCFSVRQAGEFGDYGCGRFRDESGEKDKQGSSATTGAGDSATHESGGMDKQGSSAPIGAGLFGDESGGMDKLLVNPGQVAAGMDTP